MSAEVLVVDDDSVITALVRRIVERMGYRCSTADSGESAVAQLSNKKFDLVITDINMSGLSGLEVLETALESDPDLAVMVVSGVDDAGTAETAIRAGAFGYVVKPFGVIELQIAVSNALRRRELELEVKRHLHDLEAEVERRTEQLRDASREAREQERRFRSLAQASPLGIVYSNLNGDLDYCNANAEAVLGRQVEQLSGRRWLSELDTSSRDQLAASIRGAAAGVPDAMCEYELCRPDGSTVWLRSRVAPVQDEDRNSTGVVVLFEDIGDRKHLEQQLRHQASHDHLTGLPNRREFRNQVAKRLIALDANHVLGVLLVDLDQFKLVNDTYGHEAGDQLIVNVGERLVDCAPPGALVARLGGDEYVIAISEVDQDLLVSAGQRVREELRKPVQVMGVELSLSVSVGIGVTRDPHTPTSALLRSADIAMHRAKERRDVVEVFDASMAKEVARRLALTSELRRAVDDQLLGVHYQPIVDADTQRLVGLEALARWTHHEWGNVGPNEFIPIAESMGIVHEIDRQTLITAVRQLAHWQATDRIDTDVFMSVNVSASQLTNSALPGLVEEVLEDAGIDGRSLCIEVTETSLVSDIDRAVPIMRSLRDLGIRIAVDDFGTGHSALSYLGHLPLDILKIDGSFVAAIGTDDVDITEAIVDLAHRFNLKVIAEGLEKPHQLERLRELRCDMVQGYLTGRPAGADMALPAASPSTDIAPHTISEEHINPPHPPPNEVAA